MCRSYVMRMSIAFMFFRLLARVGEPDILEGDSAGSGDGLRSVGGNDIDGRIEQLKDALARCHCALQNVVLLRQVLYRTEEPLRVLNECDQDADGDGA